MPLRLRPLELATLDTLAVDSYAIFVASDERPLSGLGGLLDWRLCGSLSRLLTSELLVGSAAESLLTTTHGALPGMRVFAFGLGPRDRVTSDVFSLAARRAAEALRAAKVGSVAIGLPELPKTAIAARLVVDAFGSFNVDVNLLGDLQELALALPEVAGGRK